MSRARVRVVSAGGGRAPSVRSVPPLQAAELDAPGFLLALLQAADPDGDALYYDIVGKRSSSRTLYWFKDLFTVRVSLSITSEYFLPANNTKARSFDDLCLLFFHIKTTKSFSTKHSRDATLTVVFCVRLGVTEHTCRRTGGSSTRSIKLCIINFSLNL